MYYSNGRAQEHLERSLCITNVHELVSAISQHTITDLPWSFQRQPHKWELVGKALLLIQFLFVPNSQASLGRAQLLPQTRGWQQTRGKGAAPASLSQVIIIIMGSHQTRASPSARLCHSLNGHVSPALLLGLFSPYRILFFQMALAR